MQTPVLSLEDGTHVGLLSSGRSVSLLVERGLEVTSVTLSLSEARVLLVELERAIEAAWRQNSERVDAMRRGMIE